MTSLPLLAELFAHPFRRCPGPLLPQQSSLDTCHTYSDMHARNICLAGILGRRYCIDYLHAFLLAETNYPCNCTGANPPLRWTVGSALFLASFAAIMGPMNYVYHLFSAPRLPFTAAYFGSIALTLVFSIKVCQGPVRHEGGGGSAAA